MRGTTLIVGAGHAGVQVAASLREQGFAGDVVIVSDEPDMPYHRPPLSKSLFSGKPPLPLRPEIFYRDNRIDLRLDTRAATVDMRQRRLHTSAGKNIDFETIVFAVGTAPRLPEIPGIDLDGVLTLRTLRDAKALAARLETAENVVVVGAGMIGLEFAAVARAAGVAVTVVEAGARVMARSLSAETASFVAAHHEAQGVRFVLNDTVTALEGQGRVSHVVTRAGLRLPADLVLVSIGVSDHTALPLSAGVAVGGGIVVNQYLEASAPNVFAIGDCAFYPRDGAMVRHESVQNATDQARCVAATIAGNRTAYGAVPWFWSDQGGVKLQMVGTSMGQDRVALRGDPAGGKFSAFCFRGDDLIGVESVNSPGDHMAARKLIGGKIPVSVELATNESIHLKKLIEAAA